MSFADLSASQKEEYVTSLAVLLCHDTETEVSADNLNAALTASNNKVSAHMPKLFADLISKGIKVEKALAGPSAGSAPAAGASAGAGAEAPVEEEEEEEEADMGAGMDMFGGGSDY